MFGHVGDDMSRSHVEGGIEIGRAPSHVVVGSSFRKPWAERKHGRRAIERLDLGLLVHAEHQCALGWVDVEPDDIAHLVDEKRVGREFERLGQMRLEPEGPPDPRDGRLAHARRLGHRSRRPVSGVSGLLFQGLHDHGLDFVVGDGARRSGPRFVEQTLEALLHEPPTPLTHGGIVDPQIGGHRLVRGTRRTGQDDPGPQSQRLSALAPPDQAFEDLALLVAQQQLCLRSSPWRHRRLPSLLTMTGTRRARRKFRTDRQFLRINNSGD